MSLYHAVDILGNRMENNDEIKAQGQWFGTF